MLKAAGLETKCPIKASLPTGVGMLPRGRRLGLDTFYLHLEPKSEGPRKVWPMVYMEQVQHPSATVASH